MKNLFTFLLATIALSMSAQVKHEMGTIHFNTTDLNYGTIKKDSDPIRKIVVSNVGKSTLFIYKCSATCGCTVPICPQYPLEPGKSDIIQIRYNTSRIGSFSKNITVWSSDQSNPISIIKIHGEVLDDQDSVMGNR